ncbi:MAG: hypothetical protein WBG74_10865 [Shewanella sp.]|uniref:AbiU2 domain-containing protein n=1 Tax=Shewanella sp. TaxID=50422 RepID=UPI003C7554B8
MDEFNRYLAEAIRVRRSIQVYRELFDSEESVNVLSSKSLEVSVIIKRALHDEILLSLARLFDSEGYNNNKELLEYLSQRNLVLQHQDLLDDKLRGLRDKTSKIWRHISVKDYRNMKLAHNDKTTLFTGTTSIRHNVSFDSATELVDTSVKLILGLMVKSGQCSVKVNLNEVYESEGLKFIEAIKI